MINDTILEPLPEDQWFIESQELRSRFALPQASLQRGDIYRLLPPDGDIHAVKTTSESESVSIHLLGNDTGCIWRHQFILESHTVKSFRFGYSHAPCKEEEEKEHAQVR
ncbi:MAG: hypothetical protein KME52_10180 [Desmonostoc geniculatum HA4340-LM1]|jgi:hypothetical protein|nr:hypothetical protein [Desmonostoc geniculatum HA4340-LM1]